MSWGDPQRLPLAQSARIAWRDVGIIGILADGRQDLPAPRAFGADRLIDHNGNACDLIKTESIWRTTAFLHLIARRDADLGEVDIEQRRQRLAIRGIDDRRGFQRRADLPGRSRELQRPGDDAPDAADRLPL